MSISRFSDRLNSLGLKAEIKDASIEFKLTDSEIKIIVEFDDKWRKIIRSFYLARQYKFDMVRRVLTSNRSVEFQVKNISPEFIYRPQYKFTDARGDEVILSGASSVFHLSFFECARYNDVFPLIKGRIEPRLARNISAHRRSTSIGD